jgi:hypothetical protein
VRRFVTLLLAAAATVPLAAGCSTSEGDGRTTGTLNVANCWTGPYELRPDFFAAVFHTGALQIRIQNGSDSETFSDGINIIVQDVAKVRPNPDTKFAGTYGEQMRVGLPPGVTPPGVPIRPQKDPPIVGMSLFMQGSCRTENVVLYAVESVTITTDGTCTADPVEHTDTSTGCNGSTAAGVGTGKSTISFLSLYSGDEFASAADRRIKGCFDVYLADPREISQDGNGPAPPCRGHLRGTFDFFYERGRPAQPFP